MGFFYQLIWPTIMSGVSGKSPFPTTYIYEYADENEC